MMPRANLMLHDNPPTKNDVRFYGQELSSWRALWFACSTQNERFPKHLKCFMVLFLDWTTGGPVATSERLRYDSKPHLGEVSFSCRFDGRWSLSFPRWPSDSVRS